MAQIAVLTGDLIGSTTVSNPAGFRDRLGELLSLFENKHDATTTHYRGDGFQIALPAEKNGFQVAILLRSGLISHSPDNAERWDARVAIAFGVGSVAVDDQQSAAYVNSGRTLDRMKKASLCAYHDDQRTGLALDISTRFADRLLSQLTPIEAEVLFLYFLQGESHQKIADQLGKQRPTVTEALRRANYSLFESYAEGMKKLVDLANG